MPRKLAYLFAIALLAAAVLLLPSVLLAQTATTGLVAGVVTDPSGAVVPGVTVSLEQQGTASIQKTVSDKVGRYVFPAVSPGDYTVRFSQKGFRDAVVNELHVQVLKSYTVNVSLIIGSASQTIVVSQVPQAELQTTTATVGTALGGIALGRLPVFTRSATSLMFYQPAVLPTGQIAGARDEQVTFALDGGDPTSDLEGSNGYASPPGEPSVSAAIPTPIESTQEFRVATTNPNSTFARSSGGQVAVLTKRGTNAFHGTAYEYHNDDALNANSWTNNRLHIAKPHSVDNRFGFSAGGPFWKNHFWFFGNYEGRRFHDSSIVDRVVPTATLQQGILRFRDATGNIVSYSLAPGSLTTACGGSSCDPRNIGASPTIMADLALYPSGNNSSLGDGLNTTGRTFNIPTPISQNLAVIRLDYKINSKWSLFSTYHYAGTSRVSTDQISLLGSAPQSVSTNPLYDGFVTLELTGQLSPTFTSVTHGSFLRGWWGWNRVAPSPLVSATEQALELAGEGVGNSNSTGKLLADPINLNTQNARSRVFNSHKWFLAQDFSWIHGHHLVQFGGTGYITRDLFDRTDNYAGGLTTGPITYIEATGNGSGEFLSVGSAYRPAICGGSVTSDCLRQSDVLRWNQLYATLLGMVDRSSQVETRNGTFQPNPLGTPVFSQTLLPAFSAYTQDVWQVRPSLTATLGLDWGVQLTPSEKNGKQLLLTYSQSNTPMNYYGYIDSRAASLNNGVLPGQAFNPLFGVTPVSFLPTPFTGQLRVTDWHNFGPHVSVAWQVPFKNRIFGDHATVIRGGYALVYDRTNDINQVSLPLTSGGLIDVAACGGPVFTGGGGLGCTNGATNPTDAFRIGVDGNGVPIPTPSAEPIPYVPSGTQSRPFGLFLESSLDPYATEGYSHSVDFTIQRELPGRAILEIGYIGRFSRNLPQDLALNAPDYLMKDKLSGQTLGQAFDAVAQSLRNGTAVPDTPFFDNQIGMSTCTGAGYANCSQMVAAQDPTDLINGSLNLFAFDELDRVTPAPIDNLQAFYFFGITDGGFSNYNAGFVSLNKSFANGLQFQFNWTWSHAIGNQGVDQQNGSGANSPYNMNLDKSSESFDRRQVLNGWWYYQLPFGGASKYALHNRFLDNLAGGWYTSGIWTFYTGLPMYISGGGDYGAFESHGTAAISSMRLHGLEGLNSSVVGSGGIATAGNSSSHGSGLNLFSNPGAVYNSLSRPLISQYTQIPFDQLRMLPQWNVDLSFGKDLFRLEDYHLLFTADFLNAFNHVIFNQPSLSLNNPSNFGVISSQGNTPRQVLLGLKFEF
jgi:hypothetical protein